MAKYYSLFGGTTTDTNVQVVKENQIVIGEYSGAFSTRLVVSKVELTRHGYMYHLIDVESKEYHRTDIITPISKRFGIGTYYEDVNPEFMDAFEVAILRQEAERIEKDRQEAEAKAKAEHEGIALVGAERLERIIPQNVQGVIIAELNETEYTDPSYECRETRSIRTVILGFSSTSRNGFAELRKVAANLPETEHLAEYNSEYEHRYPGFTLGKSPNYGWSISKMTHYTRKGFIDALAYTAGDENNIRLSPSTERSGSSQSEAVAGDFIIVDYSDKAIAVFGDTKPIKDQLSALGGRFNGRLTHDGTKKAGWIFQKSKESQVRQLLNIDN